MLHPNVHQAWSAWSEEQTLYVIAAYDNPFRRRIIRELLNDFRGHMQCCPNVELWVGELAYGARPFEVTSADNPHDVQLRASEELFHKENIQTIVLSRLPLTAQYVAFLDGDFHMTRRDWALETIHQLQHYQVVQPFSSFADLGGNIYGQGHLPLQYSGGFIFNYIRNGYRVSETWQGDKLASGYLKGVGATGGALAYRISALSAIGGLLDRCILGHSDWAMAYALLDIVPPDVHSAGYSQAYKQYIIDWRIAARVLKKNVGYVDGHAIHYFHGSKKMRRYSRRDEILAKYKFNPYVDIYPNTQGVYQLNPDRIGLRDAIRAYFISRSDDDPTLHGEVPLV